MLQKTIYQSGRKMLSSGIHAVLVRHNHLLRRLYYSRLAYILLHAKSPLAPLATRIKKQFITQNTTLRLPALLKLGFREKAVREMQKIADTSASLAERLKVSWDLAVHFVEQSSQSDIQEALERLDFVLAWERNKERKECAVVLKSECLDRLGRRQEAIAFTRGAWQKFENVNLCLALANLYIARSESEDTGKQDIFRLDLINKALSKYQLEPLQLERPNDGLSLQNIHVPDCRPGEYKEGPLVTVIVPAYNAVKSLSTTLKALLNQTWQNLEILVVDDASVDGTRDVAARFAGQDKRIRLLQTPENCGPYVARNLALSQACGEFVTVNDADDWSHPRKIEIQASYLVSHPRIMANMSEWIRVFPNMSFYRRGNPGFYIAKNLSSLMFRRKPVLDQMGYWDCVRFAGDSEFLRRMKKVFDDSAVHELSTGPVAFARQSEYSLSGNFYFGHNGFVMGARKAHRECFISWHQREKNLKLDSPLSKKRNFPIPHVMDPFIKSSKSPHVDVVLATDFRLPGGNTASTVQEIKAQKSMGLQTGLVQMSRYDLNPARTWNPKILDCLDGVNVHLFVYGQEICCDLLLIRHPPVLQEYQRYLPSIKAKKIVVIVNQAPFRDYQDLNSRLYDVNKCALNMRKYFGSTGLWYPIGPSVREAFLQDANDHSVIEIADEDWVNIIDVDSWNIKSKSNKHSKPVIGRHSRDQYVKWPDNSEKMLAAYPADDSVEVKILGGAESPKRILGYIPGNWTVYPFDSISPERFLAQLDVFVYFTHPAWVEAFGRTPLEAMAAGVPVIVPEKFRPLFKEAAIYATPHEVQDIVMNLHQNREYYQKCSEVAQEFVRTHFGYEQHKRRLAAYVENPVLRGQIRR